ERIHDHDLIIEDEEPETAELRHDEHDLLRNDEQVEAARHEYADADHEIDVRHPKPRDEPASEDDVVDSRPLLTGERDTASRAGLRERVPLTLAFRHLGLGTGAARHLGLGTLAARHLGLGTGAAGGFRALPMYAALLGNLNTTVGAPLGS